MAVPFCVRFTRHRHDRHMMSSCANHAIQLKFLVMALMAEKERFPSEGDARNAFAKMGHAEEWPAGWLSTVSSACPESYLCDKSIGYVFVADGLSTKTAVEHSALVFFCPADSHQRSEQHCHAMLATELTCLKSNAEKIALLRREIGRARDGSVPYSTIALAQMQRELEARQQHETKRRT
ncbi:MAG: hypothetical protein V9H26_14500 [Verrucomicrobiota bacterium]